VERVIFDNTATLGLHRKLGLKTIVASYHSTFSFKLCGYDNSKARRLQQQTKKNIASDVINYRQSRKCLTFRPRFGLMSVWEIQQQEWS